MEIDDKETDNNGPTADHLLQWTQWQQLDSIPPTGGFAHSYGLEAAIQARVVSSPQNLKSFVIQVLENAATLLLPFVHCANKSPNIENYVKLDKLLEATLTNEVSRKASASQGAALLRVAASVFSEAPLTQENPRLVYGFGRGFLPPRRPRFWAHMRAYRLRQWYFSAGNVPVCAGEEIGLKLCFKIFRNVTKTSREVISAQQDLRSHQSAFHSRSYLTSFDFYENTSSMLSVSK